MTDEIEKLKMHSPDLTQDNIAKIAALFPGCVTERAGKDGQITLGVDFDALRQELSDSIIEGPQERYHLDWPGKRQALITANAPIAKTLRPVRSESVDFDTTRNLFIEGDNLETLKLLQETYLGKVKMIYIDPPYNTGSDLIYFDDFCATAEDYLLSSDQQDEHGNRLVSSPESSGRFHSDWLSMMMPRLQVSRNLLSEDGIIFLSIGYQEIAGLKLLCDTIFGRHNYIGAISRLMKSGGAKGTFFSPNIDYVLVYGKDKDNTKPFRMAISQDQIDSYYNKIEDIDGPRKGQRFGEERLFLPSLDIRPNQRYWIECPDGSFAIPPGKNFPKTVKEGQKVLPTNADKVWRWTYETFKIASDDKRIIFKETSTSGLVDENGNQCRYNIYFKLWLKDQQEKGKVPPNFLGKFENRQSSAELRDLEIPFDYAKPLKLIEHLIEIVRLDDEDIIMDFFAGSSTTAHGLMSQNAKSGRNNRFIMVQFPEEMEENSEAHLAGFNTITQISKERIRRAGAKILEGECHPNWNKDVGFRVLKIDSSNMADVFYTPGQTTQADLLTRVDNIKPDRSAEDLLFQVLLDWGVDLTLPITRETISGKTVFTVAGTALIACFDNGVDATLVKTLAERAPLRVVFKDTGFADDATKINVRQIFKSLSPDTDVKAI